MKELVLEYPDDLPTTLNLSDEEFAREIRFLAAAKLYELGRLSSGRAAELANVGRAEFLHRLDKYGIPAIHLDDEQLTIELQAALDLSR